MAKANIRRNALLKDYSMLNGMSRQLLEARNEIVRINKRIMNKVSGPSKPDLVESLEIVMAHMDRARKELDRSARKLKQI
ncbi:MAG: hypothetical protein KGH69_01715 [Candidatus Micrarchaeota archaeon]|nr:hypothetical protein [Candidatus Micrarchaeota archaeon]